MNPFIEGILYYKWVIILYVAVFLFIRLNRKKFEVHLGIFALYKTKWGIRLMDRLGSKYSKPIRILGYAGIIFGFAGMIAVVAMIMIGLYLLFFVPGSPATVSPLIPGVKIPGTTFFIPFWHGIIAIFIVATVHEFGHGIVARAHKVPIKNTGPFVMGPFFGAFVEPEEEVLKKKKDVAQYSIFAAGPFFNFLLAALALLIMSFLFVPATPALFEPAGVSFKGIAPGSPAESAGIENDVIYDNFNGKEVRSVDELVGIISKLNPGDTLTAGSKDSTRTLTLGKNPSNSTLPYLGVTGITSRYANDRGFSFKIYAFLFELLNFIFIISIGIGTANLLPIGPIDGGRMLMLASNHFFGEKKGKEVWTKITIIFIFIILLLMTPILKATLQAMYKLLVPLFQILYGLFA